MFTVWCVDQQRHDAERHRQRQREQNRDGMDEGFELRRQHDVHEDEGQRERQHEVIARARQFLRCAGEPGTVIRIHVELRAKAGPTAPRMAACDPPGSTLPVSVTWRCRLMRLMDEGPVPGTMCTTSSRPTRADLWTKARSSCASPSALPRKLLLGAHHHVVLIFAGVEGGGRLARHQGVQRAVRYPSRRRPGRRRAAGRSPGALPVCRCAAWSRYRPVRESSSSSPAACRSIAPACPDPAPG